MASLFDLGAFGRSIGSNIATLGTALRLPELGISERFGVTGKFGERLVPQAHASESQRIISPLPASSTFTQAGGTFTPTPSQPTPPGLRGGGDVLGAGAPQPSGGGGDTPAQQLRKIAETPGGLNPRQQEELRKLEEKAPEEPSLDFGAINEANTQLDELERQTQELLGGNIGEEAKTAATAQAEKGRQEGLTAVERRQREAETAGREAELQERRGFSEISQQLTGRFGRSAFGQGVIGQIGQNVLQTVGRIRQGVQNTIQRLFEQRQQLEGIYNEQIENANFQAAQLKQNAKVQLQNVLSQIGTQRVALASQKADLVNRALESYRQDIIDINARNTQFQQQIELARVQTDEQIRAAQAKAANVIDNLVSFSVPAGQTTFFPLSTFGGEQGAQQFIGTQLPGGLTGQRFGEFVGITAPAQKKEDPYEALLRQSGIVGG